MSEDNDSKRAEIIALPIGKKRLSLQRRRRFDPDKCRHRGTIIVDDEAGTAECENCGDLVDPFVVLSGMAIDHQCRTDADERDAKLREELRNEISSLESDLRKAKARARAVRKEDAIEQEHRRIVDQIGKALDSFCEGRAQHLNESVANGVLWGFDHALHIIMPQGTPRTALERRIAAARNEIEARRKRRGVRKQSRRKEHER